MGRMNWLPAAQQDRGYTSSLPSTHRTWRVFELTFVPEQSGEVVVTLMGPWASAGGNEVIRQELEWDALSATGTTLTNGGFEAPESWQLQGGAIATATADRPAAEGQQIARSWHNGRVSTRLKVRAGEAVTLRGQVRSALPLGYAEMPRILSRDTPAHQHAQRFLHGVNLGNYLEAPRGQDWGQNYTARDFEEIQKAGFDHVRLPIGWQNYTGSAPEYKLEEEIFGKVDLLVNQAMQHKLAVIVNVHHFDDFTTNPAAHQSRLLAIWDQIGKRYAKLPETVAFELLNEPKDAATTTVLNPIYAELISIIRQTNPTRPIFLGPGLWNRVSELNNLQLPKEEQNIIVTVHSYDPFQFTHQGASWSSPDVKTLKGICFPGPPETPLAIPSGLPKHLTEWLTQYNTLPADQNPCSPRVMQELAGEAREFLHFGEFGAYIAGDDVSRVNYCREYRRAMEAHGLGWALWDWSAGFRYWDKDRKQAVPGMHEALFGK
jgi:endoglucanase